MKLRRPYILTSFFFATLFTGASCQDLQYYQTIEASDPNIRIIGRTQLNEKGEIEFDWPGVHILFNFTGIRCAVRMDDSGKNFYDVFIDEEEPVVHSVYSDTTLVLAEHLANGNHSVKIVKRTEGNLGMAILKALLIDAEGGMMPPPAPSGRKIEFIGNSITCGYGAESDTKTEDFRPETENAYKSYASVLARSFSADYHMISHSGQGVVRNYGYEDPVSPYTMPDRYKQTMDTRKDPLWEFSSWIPDMLVINLGTNDFSTLPHPNETVFNKKYTDLIRFVRAVYDSVPVFCLVGPMIDEPCYSYVKNMVEGNRNFLNDKNVYFIGIPTYLMSESDWGAWHPNYAGHIKMAEHIVPVISSVMGWDYGEIK
jgi:lysophospholipase L1-like esterase